MGSYSSQSTQLIDNTLTEEISVKYIRKQGKDFRYFLSKIKKDIPVKGVDKYYPAWYGGYACGVLFKLNSYCYVGQVRDEQMHGKGITRLWNGNVFEGDFKNNKAEGDGKGVVSYSSNGKVEFYGKWIDGMPKRGILRINSKTYRIDFLIVYRKAKIDFENGDNYQGEIDIDNPVSIIHGRGVLTAGGVTSTGTFVNGMLQGEGVSQWQDNNKYYEYAGNFCNGKREGTGILYYERNRSSFLKIQWKNNLPVNEGTYHMNGNTFEVMYKDGERVLN